MSIYYGIIGLLLRISSPKAVYGDDKIPLLIRYIEKHFDEDITADSLAALVYMSKSGVFYHFKKATGKSPIAYLNEYRLTIASDLLLNTTRSVTDISSSVGIRDPLYFSRLFKNKYRLSPREYRSRTSVSD